MKLKLYTILDKTAGVCCAPFVQTNDAVATRTFRDMCMDKDNQVSRNPSDYSLHYLGEFDDSVGTFALVESDKLADGSYFVAVGDA